LGKDGKKLPVHESEAELVALKALTKSLLKKRNRSKQRNLVRSRDRLPDTRGIKVLSLAGKLRLQ